MDDLVTWLRAQLDEGEALAREASGAWIPLGPNPNDTRPIARLMGRHSPDRVLVEVDAKRRILDWLEEARSRAQDNSYWSYDDTEAYQALALPYADRPGYRDEWRPE